MNDAVISTYILETFAGVNVITDKGNCFFFYDPENKVPFATMVSTNDYDDVSDLDRPGVFRLNIGVSKQTYRSLFSREKAEGRDIDLAGYDFAALDRLMPHPVYGRMYWMCVLCPSDSTWAQIRPLLAEAYEIAITKYERAQAAKSR